MGVQIRLKKKIEEEDFARGLNKERNLLGKVVAGCCYTFPQCSSRTESRPPGWHGAFFIIAHQPIEAQNFIPQAIFNVAMSHLEHRCSEH